jgi:general secretion pathway protein J
MIRRAPWSGSAGFTLVEALLATLVMSIILAALATVTAQWLPNWDRGFARLQRGGLVAVGLDRLTDDLAAAEFVSADAEDKIPMFDGGELSVVFVRTILAPNAGTGLEVVRIAESSDDLGPALVRSTAPLPTGAPQNGDGEELTFSSPVVVIRAPYRVSFSYAGPDRVWRDTWHGQAALPRAVRLTLRDDATSMVLGASTSTLIHAELPARCAWAKTVADCPELGGQINALGSAGSAMIGSPVSNPAQGSASTSTSSQSAGSTSSSAIGGAALGAAPTAPSTPSVSPRAATTPAQSLMPSGAQ